MGKYPKLMEYLDRVYGQPELKEYLAKRKMWMRQQEKKKRHHLRDPRSLRQP
jgi:hypothetical protein